MVGEVVEETTPRDSANSAQSIAYLIGRHATAGEKPRIAALARVADFFDATPTRRPNRAALQTLQARAIGTRHITT